VRIAGAISAPARATVWGRGEIIYEIMIYIYNIIYDIII